DSILTGQAWVDELLDGHPERFHEEMGLNKHVFRSLLKELKARSQFGASRHVSASE
ncbi:hypothetical protein BU15DRAFT_12780, partial [Melanogaster broomeanus]